MTPSDAGDTTTIKYKIPTRGLFGLRGIKMFSHHFFMEFLHDEIERCFGSDFCLHY